ncbi:ATP-dependent RNA helicase DbpA [Lentisphaera marina]|uniref:ATP-dependent RNA helicase DbpA n=1 Tax=Lentisphaera marina TaxID=1111041 RepID=UPI002365AEA9|nr:ATP-dependent RNA helicase DbpA [Lentisphaera marina]MDD7987055.1 ATP-dependent RNA helicase DbpA [Lentisphaera marina]
MSSKDFASLPLSEDLIKNVASLGYEEMTEIQQLSLPAILEGKDLIAQAKTGTGKTAAFGLGVLSNLALDDYKIQVLILCPTRELCEQVSEAIRDLARMMPNIKLLSLGGGMPFRPQMKSVAHGAHIVVGTPGRILKHLNKSSLSLDDVKTLVLDEADRMLDMGFQEEIDAILAQTNKQRQTLLFSATYPKKIANIAKRVMHKPIRIELESQVHEESKIEQHFYKVTSDSQRLVALQLLLQKFKSESAVIFCNTKQEAKDIRKDLAQAGFSTLALHGDLEQKDRQENLVRFANKSVAVLVATDVAARGLDIDSIDLVINYHISRDFEIHVHRIGRTGRAGKSGVACSLYSQKEAHKISLLQEFLGQEIESESLPGREFLEENPYRPKMSCVKILFGKKQKLRAGNLLGALTGDKGLKGEQVGKIQIFDYYSYVAIERQSVNHALKILRDDKWKGRAFKCMLIR